VLFIRFAGVIIICVYKDNGYDIMAFVIAVIGSGGSDKNLTSNGVSLAERVGEEIAIRKAVVLTGGKGGVMKAACKGAKRKEGLTIGILPSSKEEANEFIDVALPTNMGYGRNRLVISMADAIIAIAGRWGTLNEISEACIQQKPLVLLSGSGGIVDKFVDGKFPTQEDMFIRLALSAEDAVNMAFELIEKTYGTKH
jgi:uncharacterized protein (TIGR00725 family)